MTETARSPVVVGVDGSTSATRAVRWGAHEADLRGGLIHHATCPVAVVPPQRP